MKKIVLLLMLSIPALNADSLDFMTKEDELEECSIKMEWSSSFICINGVAYILKNRGISVLFTQDSKVVKCSCEKEKDTK